MSKKEDKDKNSSYDYTKNAKPRSIRVPEELWDDFDFWTQRNGKSRTQELCSYMEYYVTREQLAGGFRLNPQIEKALEQLINQLLEDRVKDHLRELTNLVINKEEIKDQLEKARQNLSAIRDKKTKAEIEQEDKEQWGEEPLDAELPEEDVIQEEVPLLDEEKMDQYRKEETDEG